MKLLGVSCSKKPLVDRRPHKRVQPESFYANPWPECFCQTSPQNPADKCPPRWSANSKQPVEEWNNWWLETIDPIELDSIWGRKIRNLTSSWCYSTSVMNLHISKWKEWVFSTILAFQVIFIYEKCVLTHQIKKKNVFCIELEWSSYHPWMLNSQIVNTPYIFC